MKTVIVSDHVTAIGQVSQSFQEKGSYNEIRERYEKEYPGCTIKIEPRVEFFPPVGLNDPIERKRKFVEAYDRIYPRGYAGELTFQKLAIIIQYTDFAKELESHFNFIHESEFPKYSSMVYVFWDYRNRAFAFSYTEFTHKYHYIYLGFISCHEKPSKDVKPIYEVYEWNIRAKIEFLNEHCA